MRKPLTRLVIAGGGSGIGRATALRMARPGVAISVVDLRADLAQAVADEVGTAGGAAVPLVADIGDEGAVATAIDRAATEMAGIDGVVVAAGIASFGAAGDLPLADWERVMRVNLTGAFLILRACLPHLISAGGGSIVTIGSLASVIANPGSSAAYKASKGGLLQLTKSIAVDYAGDGILANCVCPGGVDTNILRHSEEAMDDRFVQRPRGESRVRPPITRRAQPEEIAAVVAFLLSEEATFVTGATIMVDGGFSAI